MEQNGQSAAKPLLNGEGSTTISKESTVILNNRKQPVYLKKRNVIYKITCLINDKCYIGSASYYDKRIGTHVSLLRKNKHKNPHLQYAWNKYGEINFTFEIIVENLLKEEMPNIELEYITKFNCLNRKFGFNMNSDTRSRRGSIMPDEAKKKIGDFWRGKKFSQKRIDELIERTTIKQGKPILCYDKEFKFIKEFRSISETSRELGVSIACISKQCSKQIGINNRKDSNYIFRYKDIV